MTRHVVVDGFEFTASTEEYLSETSDLINCTLVPEVDQGESCLSVVEIAPGTYSVLRGTHSHVVRVDQAMDGLNVWVGNTKRKILIVDPRDRAAVSDQGVHSGPSEIRSHMPGKIVRVLVREGDDVEAGQGIIVVEAMKMQNEMKSPKSAHVKKIYVQEGEAVIAGQSLILIA